MAIDWNSIITLIGGGAIGTLSSVVTQLAQGRREQRKSLDDRSSAAAIAVRDVLNKMHFDLGSAWYAEERGQHAPLDEYFELSDFHQLRANLLGEVMLIPDVRVREAITWVADTIASSWIISNGVAVDDYRVALDICEHGRDVVGRYLRREKWKSPTEKIANYERLDKEWRDEWEHQIAEQEEKKRKALELAARPPAQPDAPQ